MSVNKVIIIGRLGQDPELRYTPGGSAVCAFTVATSDSWTDKSGNKQEHTEWHSVIVWGKMAELCNQYLSKGKQVFVEGSNKTRSWDDKDGTKRYKTEIQAKVVQFLDSKSSGSSSKSNDQEQQTDEHSFSADDIPF